MTTRFWILVFVLSAFRTRLGAPRIGINGVGRAGTSSSRHLGRFRLESEGPRVLWRRDLGGGYSGIVTDGERLYTMAARATAR